MIETLISSKTRIKLLLKFFLNSNVRSYLRQLESEFGASTNAIRLELNRLEKAGLLKAQFEGNKRFFQANDKHPMYDDIHNLIRKYIGIDKLIDEIIVNIGEVKKVYLVGEMAKGKTSNIIEVVLVGMLNKTYINQLAKKAERIINKKVLITIISSNQNTIFKKLYNTDSYLLLWKE